MDWETNRAMFIGVWVDWEAGGVRTLAQGAVSFWAVASAACMFVFISGRRNTPGRCSLL